MPQPPGVWFPAIQAGTGADVFTIRLVEALTRRGIHAEITWLPHRAEFAPWSVPVPEPPEWANIVHINSWLHGRFIPAGLPLVVTLHSCVHDPALTPYKSTLQRFYHRYWIKTLEAATLRWADVVTAVSRYTAEHATKVFGRNDIVPIYNWVDTDAFCPDERQTPHSPFRLLFVGNFKQLKGIDLLPEIMRQIGEDFELRYTGTAQAFGASAELPANMIPLGRLNNTADLIKAYQDCDALLFPTRLEGFGLVALEAQACGRPVITTNGSSLPEVVENGKTGILCPVNDVEVFIAAAQRLRREPATWHRICLDARIRAAHEFSETSAVDRYLTIYNHVMTSKCCRLHTFLTG